MFSKRTSAYIKHAATRVWGDEQELGLSGPAVHSRTERIPDVSHDDAGKRLGSEQQPRVCSDGAEGRPERSRGGEAQVRQRRTHSKHDRSYRNIYTRLKYFNHRIASPRVARTTIKLIQCIAPWT
jgi:hypothetical protein